MARQRNINPQASIDEDVATMSLAARLLWAYLPCHADRRGRLKDSAFMLRCQVFPADNIDVEVVLAELASRGHIIRYAVEGRRFIQIRSFLRHQNPHKNEVESEIPPPPGFDQDEPPAAAPIQEVLNLTGLAKITEPLGKVLELHGAAPADPDPDPDPTTDPDPTRAKDGDRDVWPAWGWHRRFKAAWEGRAKRPPGQTVFYGDTGDGKAVSTLEGELARLPRDVRANAQARAPTMFAEFLASEDARTVQRKHPFLFFVQEFGALRVAGGPVSERGQYQPIGAL